MDSKELLQRYADGRRDFTWADLGEATLADCNLAQSNFNRASFASANLQRVNLSQANLTKANFSHADLTGANLTGAICRKANFAEANLTDAILDNVDWTGATLPDGSLFEAIAPPEPSTDSKLADSEAVEIAQNPPAIAPPELPINLRPHRATWKAFQADLPRPSLFLLWLGYCCFGFLISMHQGEGLPWVIAWLSSIAWLLDESLTWFAPLVGAIAVMSAAGVSVIALAVSTMVTFTLLVGLKFLGWGWRATLKDSLWVGTIVAVALMIVGWLFSDGMVSGTFPFAILLLLGVVGAGMGAIAWGQMLEERYSRKQTAWTFGGTTALGLLCGYLLALPLRE